MASIEEQNIIDAILKARFEDVIQLVSGHEILKQQLTDRYLTLIYRDCFQVARGEDLDKSVATLLPVAVDIVKNGIFFEEELALLSHFSDILFVRYEQTKEKRILDMAIDCCRQEVAATSLTNSNFKASLQKMAALLEARADHSQKLEDLDASIKCFQQLAKTLSAVDDLHQTNVLDHLARSLHCRYNQTSNEQDREAAIQAAENAVKATSEWDPRLSVRLGVLSSQRFDRYKQTSQLQDLEAAIFVARAAAIAVPENNLNDMTSQLFAILQMLEMRQERTGHSGDLDEVIREASAVIETAPQGHECLIPARLVLSEMLMVRATQARDPHDLGHATQVTQEAIDALPESDPRLGVFLSVIASQLCHRFELLKQNNDLDSANLMIERAVEITPHDNPDLFGAVLSTKVIIREYRFELYNQIEDLNNAVETSRRLVTAMPEYDPDRRIQWLKVHERTLLKRLRHAASWQDCEETIQIGQQILDLTLETHPNFEEHAVNLKNYIRHRFELTGRLEYLDLGSDGGDECIIIGNEDETPGVIKKGLNVDLAYLTEYTYEPFDKKDEIRLIRLHTTSKDLECTVDTVSLPTAPIAAIKKKGADNIHYYALSYVWGSEQRLSRILVCDAEGDVVNYIPITESLKGALYCLRDTGMASNAIWIDQICINQKDTVEKGHQVNMMAEIYAKAARVVTYVGPGSGGNDFERVRILKTIIKCYRHYQTGPGRRPDDIASGRYALPPIRFYGDDERGVWEWLWNLANGKWAERLWIMQEQLLNPNITIVQGKIQFDWNVVAELSAMFAAGAIRWQSNAKERDAKHIYFDSDTTCINIGLEKFKHSVFFDWMSYNTNVRWSRSNRKPGNEVWDGVAANSIYNLWRKRKHHFAEREPEEFEDCYKPPIYARFDGDSRDSLLQNMVSYGSLGCHDPRDRIFAMLCISSDTKKLGLRPDYSEDNTIRKLYIDTSMQIYRNSSRLDILGVVSAGDPQIGLREIEPDLPSWALHYPLLKYQSSLPRYQFEPHPDRSLKAPPRFLQPSILTLKGSFVDEVVFATPPIEFPPFPVDLAWLEPLKLHLSSLMQVLYRIGLTAENIIRLDEAIRAPLCDRACVFGTMPTLTATLLNFWLYFRYWVYQLHKIAASAGQNIKDTLAEFDAVTAKLDVLITAAVKNISAYDGFYDFRPNLYSSAYIPIPRFDTAETFEFSSLEELLKDAGLEDAEMQEDLAPPFRLVDRRSYCVTKGGRICTGMNTVLEGDKIAAFQGADKLYILRPDDPLKPIRAAYNTLGDIPEEGDLVYDDPTAQKLLVFRNADGEHRSISDNLCVPSRDLKLRACVRQGGTILLSNPEKTLMRLIGDAFVFEFMYGEFGFYRDITPDEVDYDIDLV